MMKNWILLGATLTLLATSNVAGADSTLQRTTPSPLRHPYEPSSQSLLLVAIGLLALRMRSKQSNSSDKFDR